MDPRPKSNVPEWLVVLDLFPLILDMLWLNADKSTYVYLSICTSPAITAVVEKSASYHAPDECRTVHKAMSPVRWILKATARILKQKADHVTPVIEQLQTPDLMATLMRDHVIHMPLDLTACSVPDLFRRLAVALTNASDDQLAVCVWFDHNRYSRMGFHRSVIFNPENSTRFEHSLYLIDQGARYKCFHADEETRKSILEHAFMICIN